MQVQGLSVEEYESRKAEAAQKLIDRLDAVFPGLASSVEFAEVGEG
jgi:prolycopene isomerase